MTSAINQQQPFDSWSIRENRALRNDRCQNILYKAVFEQFTRLPDIAALLLTSKSFQNSSFGANFIVNFVVDENTILLVESVLSPSSCLSMQFVPSLNIENPLFQSASVIRFVVELAKTKYLHLQLQNITMKRMTHDVSAFLRCSESWPQLRSITLLDGFIDDDTVTVIVRSAPNLAGLNLNECRSKITDVGLERIATLGGITNLNLPYCVAVTDVGLEHISSLHARLARVDLSYCNKISDIGLEHLSKCSLLSFLNFSCCHNVTDAGLQHLTKCTGLETLDLTLCNDITDVGLEHVSKLTKLSRLNLYRCDRITDEGLRHISSLGGITCLNVYGCANIGDAGMESISNFAKLRELNIAWCESISDEGLGHIAKCSELRNIDVAGCYMISNAARDTLKEENPKCVIAF